MRTSATNRKIRVLLTAIGGGTLIPRPEFQRRLVWSNKDKLAFIQTVLEGYPFPEIYIAAGNVDPETGEGSEMLVDGQQRVTTLHQYFKGSSDLPLGRSICPYADLKQEEKLAFLEYETVVRDLGRLEIAEIKRIFERINSANYALNAMEIHNARYAGEFKQFAEKLAQDAFFETNGVFSPTDVRRMQDLRFCLVLTATVMSTYFNRDEVVETYLEKYNDDFEIAIDLRKQLQTAFQFIAECGFRPESRAWKRADLFTLIIEYIRAVFTRKVALESASTAERLKVFYQSVDEARGAGPAGLYGVDEPPNLYYKAALQGTNDRGNRVIRGEILQTVLDPLYVPQFQGTKILDLSEVVKPAGELGEAAELRSYLQSLQTSAVEGNHVIPPADAAAKIADEIERQTTMQAQNLAERGNAQIIERRVTAVPTGFVEQTLLAIDDVVGELIANRATAFEVYFGNPLEDPKWDFGRIKFVVRYVSRS